MKYILWSLIVINTCTLMAMNNTKLTDEKDAAALQKYPYDITIMTKLLYDFDTKTTCHKQTHIINASNIQYNAAGDAFASIASMKTGDDPKFDATTRIKIINVLNQIITINLEATQKTDKSLKASVLTEIPFQSGQQHKLPLKDSYGKNVILRIECILDDAEGDFDSDDDNIGNNNNNAHPEGRKSMSQILDQKPTNEPDCSIQ